MLISMSAMSVAMSTLLLLAGCGTFLLALKTLTESLERNAGKGVRKLLNKISNNRFAGYGVGAAVTGIIQSSSATSVMAIGLVGAGVISLFQANAIILGANLGTTITGYIVALTGVGGGGFKLSYFFGFFTLVGMLMTFVSKRPSVQKLAPLIAGFGMLFVGMDVMSSAFKTMQDPFKDLFGNSALQNPFLLIILGIGFTTLIQSSSAANGVFVSMVLVNVVTLEQALFLVIGSNVGTCITAVLACIGAIPNAKRVAVFHLMFNVFAALTFGMLTVAFAGPVGRFFDSVFGVDGRVWSLAVYNSVYNFLTAMIIIPFLNPINKLLCKMIKDAKTFDENAIKFINENMLLTPLVAVAAVQKEVLNMAAIARTNLQASVEALTTHNVSEAAKIYKREDLVNYLNRTISGYLIQLSGKPLGNSDKKLVGSLHHVINDIERIGDHAKNFTELAEEMNNRSITFSDTSVEEIKEMYEKINEMLGKSLHVFEYRDRKKLADIVKMETEVDSMCKVFSVKHIERMQNGLYSAENGTFFYDVISELERIGDHAVNISFSIVNPTGSTSGDLENEPAAKQKKPLPTAKASSGKAAK